MHRARISLAASRSYRFSCPSRDSITFCLTVTAGNEKLTSKIASELARLVCRHFEVDIESSGRFEVLEDVEPGRIRREAMKLTVDERKSFIKHRLPMISSGMLRNTKKFAIKRDSNFSLLIYYFNSVLKPRNVSIADHLSIFPDHLFVSLTSFELGRASLPAPEKLLSQKNINAV